MSKSDIGMTCIGYRCKTQERTFVDPDLAVNGVSRQYGGWRSDLLMER